MHVAKVRYYVTTTVSSVNYSVQDSMSVQCSCGEISFTQHSKVQFQTSTHLQRAVEFFGNEMKIKLVANIFY